MIEAIDIKNKKNIEKKYIFIFCITDFLPTDFSR